MKKVNRETLLNKIGSLELMKEIGAISLNGEYTLAAYKMLLTTMDAEPVAWTSEEAIAEVYCDETAMMGPKHMVGDVALYRRTTLGQK